MDESGRGFFENAVGFVEPGRLHRGPPRRAGGRRHLPRGGGQVHLLLAAQRALVVLRLERPRRGGRQGGGEELGLQGEGRSRSSTRPTSTTRSARTAAPRAFSSPTSATRPTAASTSAPAFFWAMGRSLDQTFYADYLLEGRLRLRPRAALRRGLAVAGHASARTSSRYKGTPSILDPDTGEVVQAGHAATTDYDVDWNALQMLPGKVRATVNVRKYSDLTLQPALPGRASTAPRTAPSAGRRRSRRTSRLAVLSAYADTTSTYFGTDFVRINGRLPGLSLRRFPRQVGWGGVVFGLEATADRLRYGDDRRVDHWARFDFAPTVSRPLPTQLPRSQPLVRLPLHPLRRELRGERGGARTRSSGPPSTGRSSRRRWRCGGRPSRASSTPPASATPSASSTRSGPRSPGPTGRGSRTSTRSPSSTGTTTTSARTRSPTRSSSASTRSAAGRPARRCPTSSSTGGSCRPTTCRSRTGRTTSTRTTRPPRSAPASSPSTSRPSCRACG